MTTRTEIPTPPTLEEDAQRILDRYPLALVLTALVVAMDRRLLALHPSASADHAGFSDARELAQVVGRLSPTASRPLRQIQRDAHGHPTAGEAFAARVAELGEQEPQSASAPAPPAAEAAKGTEAVEIGALCRRVRRVLDGALRGSEIRTPTRAQIEKQSLVSLFETITWSESRPGDDVGEAAFAAWMRRIPMWIPRQGREREAPGVQAGADETRLHLYESLARRCASDWEAELVEVFGRPSSAIGLPEIAMWFALRHPREAFHALMPLTMCEAKVLDVFDPSLAPMAWGWLQVAAPEIWAQMSMLEKVVLEAVIRATRLDQQHVRLGRILAGETNIRAQMPEDWRAGDITGALRALVAWGFVAEAPDAPGFHRLRIDAETRATSSGIGAARPPEPLVQGKHAPRPGPFGDVTRFRPIVRDLNVEAPHALGWLGIEAPNTEGQFTTLDLVVLEILVFERAGLTAEAVLERVPPSVECREIGLPDVVRALAWLRGLNVVYEAAGGWRAGRLPSREMLQRNVDERAEEHGEALAFLGAEGAELGLVEGIKRRNYLAAQYRDERDALAKAIAEAARAAGIYNGEVGLRGPDLILLAQNLGERIGGDPLEAIRAAIASATTSEAIAAAKAADDAWGTSPEVSLKTALRFHRTTDDAATLLEDRLGVLANLRKEIDFALTAMIHLSRRWGDRALKMNLAPARAPAEPSDAADDDPNVG